MPISVLNDCLTFYADRSDFRMRADFPGFGQTTNRYLPHVRREVANRNFDEFHSDWNVNFNPFGNPKRTTFGNVNKAMAKRVNLPDDKVPIFDDLWEITWEAKKFKDAADDAIKEDLRDAYDLAARVASDTDFPDNRQRLTWDRIIDAPPAPNYVVFSDHHMMNHSSDFTLINYFKRYNRELYMDILNVYADATDWCLIENGDVEECIIYEVSETEANMRKNLARHRSDYPITQEDSGWDGFMQVRYASRELVLADLIVEFSDYYALIRDRFIERGKYVRTTGNHDTYSDTERERELLEMIESPDALNAAANDGGRIQDVVRIRRNEQITHVVMHGHQFDTVSIQSGDVPYALSLGEVFSETQSWIYEGPDRFWPDRDCRAWLAGGSIRNILARETASEYEFDATWNLLNAGGDTAREKIASDTAGFIENLLGHEIAWEYFENSDKFLALGLEVLQSDEWFKFRHLNERDLCSFYQSRYVEHAGLPLTAPIPKLVLGHTHEPRRNAVDPSRDQQYPFYLNSGSAGRFENLIWAVEITPTEDRIVSWSRVKGRLRKTIWRDTYARTELPTVPGMPAPIVHDSKLEHDRYEFY